MKIWWCQEHGQAEDGEGLCFRGRNGYGWTVKPTPCRMVPMRLIPDNAELCELCSGAGKVFARNPYAPQFVDGTHLDVCPKCHGAGEVIPALDGETP